MDLQSQLARLQAENDALRNENASLALSKKVEGGIEDIVASFEARLGSLVNGSDNNVAYEFLRGIGTAERMRALRALKQ
jgi:hypothetical protein